MSAPFGARAHPSPAAALLATAAAAMGAAFAATAWAVHPLFLPAALGGLAVAAVTLRRPEVGVAAGFLLVPLSNLGLTGEPRWALTTAWGAFLCLLGLWRRTAVGGSERAAPPLSVAILLYVVVVTSAFVLGGAAEESFPELRSVVTGALYFGGIALLVRSPRQVLWCLGGIAAAVALVGLVAARERLSGVVVGEAFFTPGGELIGRAAAGFGHPNALGGFLVVLVPFAVAGALLARRARWAFAAAALAGAYGIYASFSRGALLGLALVPLFFLRRRQALLVVPILAVLLVVATPGLVRARGGPRTESGSEVATRVDFWSTALVVWSREPVLGTGLGRFPEAYAEVRVPGRGFLPGTISQPPPHAHNLVLQTLATQGLVGLVALAGVLGSALAVALALRRRASRPSAVLGSAALAALAAFLCHNQFDVTLLEGTGIYFWALLGLVAGAASAPDPEVP